jgi:hypothetical protein
VSEIGHQQEGVAGLTQHFLQEEASLRYLEPNRWLMALPGCVVTDEREGVDGWNLGILADGSNVSSFLIGRVEVRGGKGSQPGVTVIASNEWVKAGNHDPVATGTGGTGDWTVWVEIILHTIDDENPPQDVRVEAILI